MYIKYSNFTGNLSDGDILLMSHEEFVNGGKDIVGVPVTVTPDGSEPLELEIEDGA